MSFKQIVLFISVAALSGYIAGCQGGKLPESHSTLSSQEFHLIDNFGNVRMRAFMSGADEEGLSSGTPVLTISDPLGRVLTTYSLEEHPRERR